MSLFKISDEEIKKKFLEINTLSELAALLEISKSQLVGNVFITPDDRKYLSFKLQKKSGGERIIFSPKSSLKLIQQKLSYILYLIYNPRISTKGFVRGQNIITNATLHVNQNTILNIDLENFFPSINFGRVYGLFLKKPFNFNKKVAALLAQICCFQNKLPQGAPTSPIISNMICATLDNEFQKFSRKYAVVYSRYADDITFSTRMKKFPEAVAIGNLNVVELGEEIVSIINTNGFLINQDKVRIQKYYHRQVVTGLLVNKSVNVQKRYVKKLRGIVHSLHKHGFANTEAEFQRSYQKQVYPGKGVPQLIDYLKGKLSFLAAVKGQDSPVYITLIRNFRPFFPKDFLQPLTRMEALLFAYNDLAKLLVAGTSISKIERGFSLEKLMTELFHINEIKMKESFKRELGSEQIDGAIYYDSWNFLVECKWKAKPIDTSEIDSFSNKIGRSGSQTSGIFISINGWSANVVKNLQANPNKNIILIDGADIEAVLSEKIKLTSLISNKLHRLNIESRPFVAWNEL